MQFFGSAGHQGGAPQQPDRPCREFSATGRCRWGANCRSSHDVGPEQQVQDMPRGPVHRGNMCTQWINTGHCTYGQNCRFAHGEPPMQQFPGPSPQLMQQQQQMPAPVQHYNDMGQQPPAPMQQLQLQQQMHSAGDPGQQPPQQMSNSRPPAPQGQLQPGLQQQKQPQQPQQPAVQQAQLQQQQQSQQQQQQQQQEQGPPPAYCFPKPGRPSYVDCVRAICEALNIGQCGEMVTDETRAAAMRSFYNRSLFRESRFADGLQQYLPA